MDPDRSDAFVVDVERGEKFTDDDGEVRIGDVVELQVIDTGERAGVIRTSRATFARDHFVERSSGFNQPMISKGYGHDGGDKGLEDGSPAGGRA